MTEIISIVASIFNLLSGGFYFKQLIKKESIPNPATWIIWFVITILNTATYFLVVKGNFWVSLASAVLAFGISIIFITALIKGRFSPLRTVEIISLILAIGIGIFWKVSGNPLIANIALQVIFLISFYPTAHALLTGVAREKSLPWFFAATSYLLQIINVMLNPVTLFALVFPIVNLIGNGGVGVIAYLQNRRTPH